MTRKRRSSAWLVAGVVLLCLAAGARIEASLENALVFPGSATQGRPYAVIEPGDAELVRLCLADGTPIVAEFGKALGEDGRVAPDAPSRPTVIFFYGNGSFAAGMTSIFNRYRHLGMNIIIPDYPGYGMSGGRPSEASSYRTADAVYDYLLGRPDVDPARIVAAGWSMGSGVAVDLASRRPVCALELVSAFTSLTATAHRLYPWLPTSLLLKSHFNSLSKIPRVTCPILLIHGRQDGLVPATMSDALAAKAGGRVTLLKIEGAGHNDVFEVGGNPLWAALGAAVPPKP